MFSWGGSLGGEEVSERNCLHRLIWIVSNVRRLLGARAYRNRRQGFRQNGVPGLLALFGKPGKLLPLIRRESDLVGRNAHAINLWRGLRLIGKENPKPFLREMFIVRQHLGQAH